MTGAEYMAQFDFISVVMDESMTCSAGLYTFLCFWICQRGSPQKKTRSPPSLQFWWISYFEIKKQHLKQTQLVGGWAYPSLNWDDDIPNIWENKTCSKPPSRSNQPGIRGETPPSSTKRPTNRFRTARLEAAFSRLQFFGGKCNGHWKHT